MREQGRPDVDRLRSLLGSGIDRTVPLVSGTSGSSYRVEAGSRAYVAKFFDAGSDVLLDAPAQYRLLERLAVLDIAPAPVACDADLLVTELVANARPLSAREIREPARIRALAALLRALHEVHDGVPPFAPRRSVDRYVAAAGGRESLARDDSRRLDELDELIVAFSESGNSGASSGLCHNDLVGDNVLCAGAVLTLIDFDYAVNAPPILDLASVAVMNDLPTDRQHALLDAYFGAGERPFEYREFASVQRLVRLLAHFWSLASAAGKAAIVEKYRIRND